MIRLRNLKIWWTASLPKIISELVLVWVLCLGFLSVCLFGLVIIVVVVFFFASDGWRGGSMK